MRGIRLRGRLVKAGPCPYLDGAFGSLPCPACESQNVPFDRPLEIFRKLGRVQETSQLRVQIAYRHLWTFFLFYPQ